MLEDIQDEERQTRLDLRLWGRILAHARPYRRSLVGLIGCGLGLAAIDSTLPLVTRWVIDGAVAVDPGLWREGFLYLALIGVIPFLVYLLILLAGRLATGVAHDLKEKAFARLQALSFSYYDRRPVGWIMARVTSDADRLARLMPWTVLDTFWGVAFMLSMLGMMFWMHARVALVVMAVLPALAALSLIFQRLLIRSQRRVRKTNSELTAQYNEGIMGVRTTKSLVREEENLADFQRLSGRMYQESVRNALQSALYLPLVSTLGSIGIGLALWRGGVRLGDELSLGTLVAFLQYAALFYHPVEELAERFTQLQAAQASAERLQGLLDTQPQIQDGPEVLEALEAFGSDASPMPLAGDGSSDGAALLAPDGLPHRIGRIEFKGVAFSYQEGEPVLRDFDLTVRSGESIALVGATGSGKSTIVSLVARFYEPSRGRIEIDGVDYRRRSLHWLQSNLGIVLQVPHLFSGTIRENIRYGRLEASDSQVEDAARVVDAHGFISAFEQGYETGVGEGGARLSTGQKQLIALARAVLADPQIFIMDEATSSVDTETERKIQAAIERVLLGRISFVIAHRLSTVRSADRILVIDAGRIVEAGSHRVLMERRGRYHHLYINQYAQEQQEVVLQGT